MKSPQRCVKCVLPEHLPSIEFDENGVCNFCNDHDENWARLDYLERKKELVALAGQARDLSRSYDVLVPISGGKDSTFVLYHVVNELELNALAVHFDNRVQTPVSYANIQKATDKLGVELLNITPPEELMTTLRREFLLTTGECCTPCNMGIKVTIIRIARSLGIPLIANGYSPIHDGYASSQAIYQFSPEYFVNVVKAAGIENIVKGTIFDEVLRSSELFGKVGMTSEELMAKMRAHGMVQIFLPTYVSWIEDDIISTIERELGWMPDPDIGTEHTDCSITPLKYCLKREKTRTADLPGIDDLQLKLAAKVRTGQMTREEAFEDVSGLEDKPLENFMLLLEKMGLDGTHIPIIRQASQEKFL